MSLPYIFIFLFLLIRLMAIKIRLMVMIIVFHFYSLLITAKKLFLMELCFVLLNYSIELDSQYFQIIGVHYFDFNLKSSMSLQ